MHCMYIHQLNCVLEYIRKNLWSLYCVYGDDSGVPSNSMDWQGNYGLATSHVGKLITTTVLIQMLSPGSLLIRV